MSKTFLSQLTFFAITPTTCMVSFLGLFCFVVHSWKEVLECVTFFGELTSLSTGGSGAFGLPEDLTGLFLLEGKLGGCGACGFHIFLGDFLFSICT